MVPAGSPVDSAIGHLKAHLDPGDILIDGGNSFFQDTERRNLELGKEGFNFFGTGVSGGEEGVLWGSSLMPGAGGCMDDVFGAISSKVNGEPSVTYIRPRGAGHYVKIVHNGIEYGDYLLLVIHHKIAYNVIVFDRL